MPSGLLGESATGSTVDVGAMLDSDIPGLCARIVEMGCLVSIGSTRDRGAMSLTITHEGSWDREYFRQADEAADWLRGAIKVLAGRGLGDPVADPPVTQKPRRGRSRLA